MEWQPIETAPKDGTSVLLWLGRRPIDTNDVLQGPPEGDVLMVIGWWSGFLWESAYLDESPIGKSGAAMLGVLEIHPTHWMPLPEPPQHLP